jgi:hypothetical protein
MENLGSVIIFLSFPSFMESFDFPFRKRPLSVQQQQSWKYNRQSATAGSIGHA